MSQSARRRASSTGCDTRHSFHLCIPPLSFLSNSLPLLVSLSLSPSRQPRLGQDTFFMSKFHYLSLEMTLPAVKRRLLPVTTPFPLNPQRPDPRRTWLSLLRLSPNPSLTLCRKICSELEGGSVPELRVPPPDLDQRAAVHAWAMFRCRTGQTREFCFPKPCLHNFESGSRQLLPSRPACLPPSPPPHRAACPRTVPCISQPSASSSPIPVPHSLAFTGSSPYCRHTPHPADENLTASRVPSAARRRCAHGGHDQWRPSRLALRPSQASRREPDLRRWRCRRCHEPGVCRGAHRNGGSPFSLPPSSHPS